MTCRHRRTITGEYLEACVSCPAVRHEALGPRWMPDASGLAPDLVALASALREQARRPRGRPRSADDVRDVELRVRLAPAELDALDALAARWRVTRSDAVRAAVEAAQALAEAP